MKTILSLAIIALMSVSNVWANCPYPEAQFIGAVTSSNQVQAGCLVELNYSYYATSGVCPLYLSEAQENGVLLEGQSCPSLGSTLSGVLVTNEQGQVVQE